MRMQILGVSSSYFLAACLNVQAPTGLSALEVILV